MGDELSFEAFTACASLPDVPETGIDFNFISIFRGALADYTIFLSAAVTRPPLEP